MIGNMRTPFGSTYLVTAVVEAAKAAVALFVSNGVGRCGCLLSWIQRASVSKAASMLCRKGVPDDDVREFPLGDVKNSLRVKPVLSVVAFEFYGLRLFPRVAQRDHEEDLEVCWDPQILLKLRSINGAEHAGAEARFVGHHGDAHGNDAWIVPSLGPDRRVEEDDDVGRGNLVRRVLVAGDVPRPGEGAEDRGKGRRVIDDEVFEGLTVRAGRRQPRRIDALGQNGGGNGLLGEFTDGPSGDDALIYHVLSP